VTPSLVIEIVVAVTALWAVALAVVAAANRDCRRTLEAPKGRLQERLRGSDTRVR
jgi:hypothetical protein